MKILFVDGDNQAESLLKHISSMTTYEVFICHDFEQGIKEYNDNDIDIVIIDPTKDFGRKTLDYILKKKPRQKVITISDYLGHTEPKGCDYCQKYYNKVRLFNPIDVHELVGYLKDFHHDKCTYKDKFDSPNGLISIMDKIIKNNSFTSYDKQHNIVKFDSIHSDYYNFLFMLKEKKIKYTIDGNNIKLIENQ